MRSSVRRVAGWCLSALEAGGGWRIVFELLAVVSALIVLAGDRVGVEAEEYSAYSDPEKPVISVILSEQQNVDEFEVHFGLTDGQVADVLGAVRRENRTLAQTFGESEHVLAANKDLPKDEIAKKIASSDYDESVAAAVARTKRKIQAILPEDKGAGLKSWVDEQWRQEVRTASTEDFTGTFTASSGTYTASYYRRGIRCKVFATQYVGNTRREAALPHRRLKFGSQPRVGIRRASGGPKARPKVKEVGPWNTYDNYWAPRERRTMWKSLPRCKPEAQAAYFRNFNRGKDEFGRKVLNPGGVDLTPAVARDMGLKKYQNAWVYVRFPWVHR